MIKRLLNGWCDISRVYCRSGAQNRLADFIRNQHTNGG
jgi:hypothetical protein